MIWLLGQRCPAALTPQQAWGLSSKVCLRVTQTRFVILHTHTLLRETKVFSLTDDLLSLPADWSSLTVTGVAAAQFTLSCYDGTGSSERFTSVGCETGTFSPWTLRRLHRGHCRPRVSSPSQVSSKPAAGFRVMRGWRAALNGESSLTACTSHHQSLDYLTRALKVTH